MHSYYRMYRLASACLIVLVCVRQFSVLFGGTTIPHTLVHLHSDGYNRTLVVIIGNLRGGESAWKTLYKNVLDVNRADLALMIGETEPEGRNSSLFQRATYHWTFPEYEDWADAVDLVNGTAWRTTLVPLMHSHSPILGGVKMRRFAGSGAVIFMIRWFLTNKIKEYNLTTLYDRFIITRSDHYYMCAHDVSNLERGFLHVPEGQQYGGITDRHLIVDHDHVLEALNILPPLLTHPENYSQLIRRRNGNPERLIKHVWRQNRLEDKVKRFPRLMFTCAVPGDPTRWSKMQPIPVPEGVMLKYPKEYNASRQTCNINMNGRDSAQHQLVQLEFQNLLSNA